MTVDPIRFETEDMLLGGAYQIESGSFASDGSYIGLTGPTGTASTTFTGVTGIYTVTVAYYDESDGVSSLTVNIGGNEVDSWAFDNSPGGSRAKGRNLVTRTIATNLAITNGAQILIEGLQESGENARVDYIEFVLVEETGGGTPPTNTNPVANNDALSTLENSAVVIDVLANDTGSDGDTLTVAAFDAVSANGGSVSQNPDGTLTYTPSNGYIGTDTFNYTISDGQGGNATGMVTVTVNSGSEPPPPVNTDPVANNDALSTPENSAVVIDVLANDTDSDGDSLTVAAFDAVSANGGSVSQNPDGTLTYTPSNGYIGTDTFNYTISDGQGGNATGMVTVTVEAPPAPTADPIRLETEDMLLGGAYQIESGSFASDGSYIGLTGPTGTASTTFTGVTGIYTVTVAYYDESDGVSSLTVNIGGNEVDSWAFDNSPGGSRAKGRNLVTRTIATNLAITNGAQILIEGLQESGENARVDYIEFVLVEETGGGTPPTNTNPVANNDALSTLENSAVVIDVLANDTDSDGDTLTVAAFDAVSANGGSVSQNPDGTLTYTPSNGYIGTDTFNYTISDGQGGNATGMVTVTVNSGSEPPPPVNTDPVANNDALSTPENSAVVIDVLANDTDSDGDSLTVAAFDAVSANGGSVSQNPDGTLTYTPSNGYIGTDTFNYTISDGQGGNATGMVTVTVEAPPAPTADPIRLETEDMLLGGAYQIESGSFASDGSYIGLTGPTGTASTTFTGVTGIYTVTVAYYDESDGVSSLTVNIGGNEVDSWAFDNSPGGSRARGSNLVTRTIATNLAITNGAQILIEGLQESGENARVDYIEFVLVEETGGGTPPTNTNPVANNDALSTLENSAVVIDVLANDTDSDGDTLTVAAFDAVSANGGSVSQNPDGTLTYTPSNGYIGTDTFNYTISDGQGGNATGMVTVTVEDSTSGGEGEVADYSAAQAGVILNLATQTALSPVFGALDTPRLMPLGDSITAGQHSSGAVPGGYRIQFWQRSEDDGLAIDFVGSQENSSGGLGDDDHEGRPGWKIDRIRTDIVEAGFLTQYPSDAIMLMIGTNDANGGVDGLQMRNRLINLIDAILAADPDTYLFVSSIPPVDSPRGSASESKAVDVYNGLIDDVADSYSNVYFVNAGGSLDVGDINGDNSDTNDLDDGLHPTEAGYAKLGDAWYDGIFNPESLAGKSDLIGSNFADRLIGNSGSNQLTGGGGADELTGNGGADVYIYQQASEGLDEITDFSSNDLLWVSAAGFGGGLVAGALDSARFVLDGTPTQSIGTFLFDTASHILSFDQDGSGGAHTAQAIARFTNGFTIQASHIEVIA
jgi:lysophospholipase L1-like esterase/ribosomal protein L27